MTIGVADKAPDFSAPTDSGGTASLKVLKGRKVVLYFYPVTNMQIFYNTNR